MSGAAGGAPPPTVIGPVGVPRGRFDVEVGPAQVVLHPRSSWRDWFDSDAVVALLALAGIAVALGGLAVGGPLGVAISVVGLLMLLPLVVHVVVTYGAMAFVVVQTAVRMLTPSGRARLRRGAARMAATLRETGPRRLPRHQVGALGPVELGRRARLRLGTSEGELVLTTARRHRGRLEEVARCLAAR